MSQKCSHITLHVCLQDEDQEEPEFLDRRARRTRAKVDYTSEEALKKAGITKKELDDDDDDEDFHEKPTEEDD